jgi:hypothetical protein
MDAALGSVGDWIIYRKQLVLLPSEHSVLLCPFMVSHNCMR